MGRINVPRVVAGGLLAGLVINISESILNLFVIAAPMDDALKARNLPAIGGGAIGTFVILCFVLGITIVWLYAAIRPRFGPGPGTAMKGAVFAWVLVSLAYSGYLMSGMTSATTWCMLAVAGLINFAVVSWIGAMMYSEPMAA